MDSQSISPEALALLFDEPVYRFGERPAGTCKGKNLERFLMVFDKLPDLEGNEARLMFQNFLNFGGYTPDDIGQVELQPGHTVLDWRKLTNFDKLLVWSDQLQGNLVPGFFQEAEKEGIRVLQAYSLARMSADRDAKIALSKAFESLKKNKQ